jgi:hypothetical protein
VEYVYFSTTVEIIMTFFSQSWQGGASGLHRRVLTKKMLGTSTRPSSSQSSPLETPSSFQKAIYVRTGNFGTVNLNLATSLLSRGFMPLVKMGNRIVVLQQGRERPKVRAVRKRMVKMM